MIFQNGLETFIFQRILIGLEAILETYLESMVLPVLYVCILLLRSTFCSLIKTLGLQSPITSYSICLNT